MARLLCALRLLRNSTLIALILWKAGCEHGSAGVDIYDLYLLMGPPNVI
jgi:hypothetical protein